MDRFTGKVLAKRWTPGMGFGKHLSREKEGVFLLKYGRKKGVSSRRFRGRKKKKKSEERMKKTKKTTETNGSVRLWRQKPGNSYS